MHENCVPREEFEQIVGELKTEIERLKARLARYENPHTPPSMRVNRYPQREPTGNPVGKPAGSHGATRKLEHTKPDEIIEVKPERCSCGAQLGAPAVWKTKRVLDIPPPQRPILREFRLGECICAHCGKRNVTTHPECPTAGEYGPRTLAFVNDLRFRERFSIAMIKTFLHERYGLDVNGATIIDMGTRTARALRFAHNALVMRIRNAHAVYVDETGFYINGVRVWCWIFTTERDALVAIRCSRGSRVPRAILGDGFHGVIVSDCFAAYELLKKQLYQARFQKCWAHLLRESHACAQETGEGRYLHAELKHRYGAISAFIVTQPPPDIRKQEYEGALAWLDEFANRTYAEPRNARLAKRLARHREDWFTCIREPGIEATNNRAERALRPQVILRKLRSLRSERGREDHEVMTSLFATWQSQGLNPTLQLETELSEVFAEGGFM